MIIYNYDNVDIINAPAEILKNSDSKKLMHWRDPTEIQTEDS
jgi:hypothetical protein